MDGVDVTALHPWFELPEGGDVVGFDGCNHYSASGGWTVVGTDLRAAADAEFSQTVELCVGPDGERVDTGFPFGLIEIIPSEERLTISITRSYGGDLVATAAA